MILYGTALQDALIALRAVITATRAIPGMRLGQHPEARRQYSKLLEAYLALEQLKLWYPTLPADCIALTENFIRESRTGLTQKIATESLMGEIHAVKNVGMSTT